MNILLTEYKHPYALAGWAAYSLGDMSGISIMHSDTNMIFSHTRESIIMQAWIVREIRRGHRKMGIWNWKWIFCYIRGKIILCIPNFCFLYSSTQFLILSLWIKEKKIKDNPVYIFFVIHSCAIYIPTFR